MTQEIKLPPLPNPAFDDFDNCAMFSSVQMINYARAAVQADRQQRGEPVPKGWKLVPETPTSKQIVHMACQIKGADADGWFRTDGDDWPEHVDAAERAYKWALSEAPQPAEPKGCQMGEHGCDDPSQCWEPCGELGNSKEHAKVAEPVEGPSDEEILKWAGEEQFFLFCDEDEFLQIARAVLARYGQPDDQMFRDLEARVQSLDAECARLEAENDKLKSAVQHGGKLRAVAAREQPVVNQSLITESDREAMAVAFETWWSDHGQYCRSGGGDYEKTFAYRAFQAGRAALQSQDDPLQPAANWLFKAIAECKVADIRWALRIGHNRAQRLFDHARRVEGGSHEPI